MKDSKTQKHSNTEGSKRKSDQIDVSKKQGKNDHRSDRSHTTSDDNQFADKRGSNKEVKKTSQGDVNQELGAPSRSESTTERSTSTKSQPDAERDESRRERNTEEDDIDSGGKY